MKGMQGDQDDKSMVLTGRFHPALLQQHSTLIYGGEEVSVIVNSVENDTGHSYNAIRKIINGT